MEVSGRDLADNDDTSTGVHCDPCVSLNKNENAEHYCVDCDEFFCSNCSSVHKMSKLSKNHKFLSWNEMPRQKLISTEENVCPKHSGEVLKYFCKDHDNFYCNVCVTLEHKICSTEHIDDVAADFETSTAYRCLTEKISSLLQQLKDIKISSIRNSQGLQAVYTQFVSDVKTFRTEINNLLDSMETIILKEAQNVKEFDTDAAQTVSSACDTIITDIEGIGFKLETLKQYKQQRQLVISAKKAESKTSEYEKKISDICNQNKVRHYEFHKNKKMLNSLKSMHSLGSLVERQNEKEKSEIEKKQKENVNLIKKDPKSVRARYAGQTNNDPESVGASYVGQINIKHFEDYSDCVITGSVMIDQYRIALTDRQNTSVKLVNIESKSIISYVQLYPQPWDVTCIDKNQLVITCNNKLVFVDVGNTLTINKEFKIHGGCRGIVCHHNQLFVSFVSPEPAVKLISLSGEILKILSTDTNGQPMFERPLYICLSQNKSTLFVSDNHKGTITSMDLNIRVQNVYRDTRLITPRGLAGDRYDNVYVAGRDSHNLHQITTDCRPVQILLDQKQGMVEYPQSITYCETGNKLYISNSCGNKRRNSLYVYQLQ